jgi:hypothetical protein
MLSKEAKVKQKTISRTTIGAALGWIAAWAWTIVAGGGGLWLLWTKGPWPLTNGWFALLSGLSACPALLGSWKNTRESRSQVMFGWPLLLPFSPPGELLWRWEANLTLISKRDSKYYPSAGRISLRHPPAL